MSNLDKNYNGRDYLYGRLLAIADRIESDALFKLKQERPTAAARLMQRFATNPYSTWRTLELGLRPYLNRFPAKFKISMDELKSVYNLFEKDDFISDAPLTGEFLLGYNLQDIELTNTFNSLKKQTGTETETGE